MVELNDNIAATHPLISIIIPTFNVAKVIEACLRSIVTQNFIDYEILIMDGLSVDTTSDLVNRYKENHSGINFFSEKDRGTYDAMNKGIALAKGEWLYFLGADDELHDENVLQEISKILIDCPADMVYGDVVLTGDTPFGKAGTRYDGRYDVQKIIRHCICHQAIFYKRSVFEKIGNYDLRYTVCADWDANQKCFAFLKTHYVDLAIAKFSPGGLSSQIKDDFYLYDRVLNANRYLKIGFFSSYFKGDFTIFRKVSARFLRHGNLHKAFFFMLVALYQGRQKILQYILRQVKRGVVSTTRRGSDQEL